MELLLKAIQELKEEGCMQQALYDQLVNRKVKLNFGMYSNPNENSAAPNYDPRDKFIKFKENSTITKENLKEELFHARQDAYYEGGIYQYREPGKVNIEFEAKVFKDLILEIGTLSAFYKEDTPEEKDLIRAYELWIYKLRDDYTILQDSVAYNYWLDIFNEHDLNYSSPKSNDFSFFHSIKYLYNKSNCF